MGVLGLDAFHFIAEIGVGLDQVIGTDIVGAMPPLHHHRGGAKAEYRAPLGNNLGRGVRHRLI